MNKKKFCSMIRYNEFFYKYFSRSITIERDFFVPLHLFLPHLSGYCED